jgi:hypothetical protein
MYYWSASWRSIRGTQVQYITSDSWDIYWVFLLNFFCNYCLISLLNEISVPLKTLQDLNYPIKRARYPPLCFVLKRINIYSKSIYASFPYYLLAYVQHSEISWLHVSAMTALNSTFNVQYVKRFCESFHRRQLRIRSIVRLSVILHTFQ